MTGITRDGLAESLEFIESLGRLSDGEARALLGTLAKALVSEFEAATLTICFGDDRSEKVVRVFGEFDGADAPIILDFSAVG